MAVQSRQRNARERFRVHERLIDDYGRFTRGFIDIADKRIAASIEEAIEAGLLRPDPWIQLNPNFERGAPGDLGAEGMGSGKSLIYIVPTVDCVLQKGSGRGIGVVYPASDQLDEAFFSCLPTAANEVDHVMDTFPIVRRTDEAAHGEYRTKRALETTAP